MKIKLGIIILLICVVIGCSDGDSGVIQETDLTDALEFPMVGNAPQAQIDTPWFTGEVEWFFAEDIFEAQDGYFEPYTEDTFESYPFRSVLTLTAKGGFTFAGLSANIFSHESAYAARNPAGSSNTLQVTLEFPAAPNRNTNPVTMTNLLYTIFQPVAGEIPQSSITNSLTASQYTGIIEWMDSSWRPLQANAAFEPNTSYIATVVLVPGAEYRLNNLNEENLSHPGAHTIRYTKLTNNLRVEFYATGGTGTIHRVTNYNLGAISQLSRPRQASTPPTSFQDLQFTGTMQWTYSDDDTPVDGPVIYGKPLKVIATLTARQGYTFIGVPDNIFIHTSAAVTNMTSQEGTITIWFTAPPWEIGQNSVSIVPISTAGGASVLFCCFHVSFPPNNIINGDISGSPWQYGWGPNNSNDSSWPSVFMRHMSVFTQESDTRSGHLTVFTRSDIPEEIRKGAHVFTLDMGRVVDNIVRIGFNANGSSNFPYEGEVYFSETEIGPLPGANASYAGLYSRPQDQGVGAGTWVDFDIISETGRPFSARYIHVRILKSQITQGIGGTIDLHLRQVRIGTVDAQAYPGN